MRKNVLRTLVATAALTLLLGGLAATAAPSSVQIITPYPSVSVSAGKTVTFTLRVKTPARQRVNLAITETPPGWQATLRGGGFVVRGVFGHSDEKEAPEVQLEVRVPADAAKGDYRVVVRAESGGATDSLPFDVQIAEVAEGAVTLSAEFPSLKGTPDAALRYSLTLTNNTPEATTFDLAAEAPEDWTVNVRPSGQTQASTVKVEGGQSSTLEVEATPPASATAGKYDIKVRAVGGGKTAETTVVAEITGNVRLTLTTPNERLNADAVAGRRTDLTIEVRNEGTSAVQDVKLSSTPPSGWRVTFSPSTIKRIDPKKTARATARITPTGDAVAGDYVLSLSANATGGSDTADIRVTVETSKIWGAIGILVIIGAVYILFRVFRQYGRR